MAGMLHIGAGFLTALDDYVQSVCAACPDAAREGLAEYVSDLQDRASSLPNWRPVSHAIEAWYEDDELQVGVRDPRYVAQAMKAEFGDKDNPPVPLLRTSKQSAGKAGQKIDKHLRETVGGL